MSDYTEFSCGNCGITFCVPTHFANECHKEGANKTWYCPNGHPRVFRESTADKLRQERDRLKQQLAQKDDEIVAAHRTTDAERKKTTRLEKRIKAGVCPCCQRTFSNMASHIKTKHPDYGDKPSLKVVA